MKYKFLLFNSIFLVKATGYIEYEGYFKGRKLDTECCKNKTLDEVKKGLNKNEEFKLLEEKTEKRTIIEDEKDKEINVKIIKFEILEKSSIEIIESEFFQDNLRRYLDEKINCIYSYDELLDILKNYKDKDGNIKPIECGKETNGIVDIKIYNDKNLIEINDTNKNIKLNFTRIHFIFTQDLYKICPVKISIKLEDSFRNKYEKDRYTEFVCENNNTSLKNLFTNIAIGDLSDYDEENCKIIKEKEEYHKDNEFKISRSIRSPFNINTITVFKTVKKIIFKYKNNKREEVIYDEAVNNGNIEEFLNKEQFKYSHLGEYIIETDLSNRNYFHINIELNSNKLTTCLYFNLNKEITVSQFKEFLKKSNIINNNDSCKIIKTESGFIRDKNIDLGDDYKLKFEDDSNNYCCYNCKINVSDINEFNSRKIFDKLEFDKCFRFDPITKNKRCNCKPGNRKR